MEHGFPVGDGTLRKVNNAAVASPPNNESTTAATLFSLGVPPSIATMHSQLGAGVAGISATTNQSNIQPIYRGLSGSVATQATVLTNPNAVFQQSSAAAAANLQRLKVEDALTYLDQVKSHFENTSQVYNDFLDIMKEFKSQSIDTPGVIKRVSDLFRGHNELILGFNAFLPPGYSIEMANDGRHESLRVCMPGDTVMNCESLFSPMQSMIPPLAAASNSPIPGSPASPLNAALIPNPVTIPGIGVPASSNTIASPSLLPPSLVAEEPMKPPIQQPPEFSRAISYVNKIKTRFANDPDVYFHFLEILTDFQREQEIHSSHTKPAVTESDVYKRVSDLFRNEKDLMEEFGSFLPEVAGQNFLPEPEASDSQKQRSRPNTNPRRRPRTTSGTAEAATESYKTISPVNTFSISSPIMHAPPNDVPKKKQKLSQITAPSEQDASFSGSPETKFTSISEFAFFDKARNALPEQTDYENFLRCIALFNDELISKSELLKMIDPIFSSNLPPSFLIWLMEFLGVPEDEDEEDEMKPDVNELNNGALGSGQSTSAAAKSTPQVKSEVLTDSSRPVPVGDSPEIVDILSCPKYGTSYRILPPTAKINNPKPLPPQRKLSREISQCLNDTYISVPAWAENYTFAASKKTQSQEYMYRVEDEKFEMDIILETNVSAIRALEFIQKKIMIMGIDDVSNGKFNLDHYLNSTSEKFLTVAVTKIYGDKAVYILEGLRNNPLVAIPIVLKRLTDKHEEWKKTFKSFSRIWREVTDKYSLRSSDYKGNAFKQTDLKSIRSRFLLNDIESIHEEEIETCSRQKNILPSPLDLAQMKAHITCQYKNKACIQDANRLLIYFIKRQVTNKDDKCRIKRLVKHFLMDFLFCEREMLSDDEFSASELDYNIETEDKGQFFDKSHDISTKKSSNGSLSRVFCFNNNWYLFFRLHVLLCNRLASMKEFAFKKYLHAIEVENNEALATFPLSSHRQSQPAAVNLRYKKSKLSTADFYEDTSYEEFILAVCDVMDSKIDSAQFEDYVRETFGVEAFECFTIERVIQCIARQLQNLVTFEESISSLRTFVEHNSSNSSQDNERNYMESIIEVLSGNNIFKMFYLESSGVLEFTLISSEKFQDPDETEFSRWSDAVDALFPRRLLSKPSTRLRFLRKPLFLPRMMRKSTKGDVKIKDFIRYDCATNVRLSSPSGRSNYRSNLVANNVPLNVEYPVSSSFTDSQLKPGSDNSTLNYPQISQIDSNVASNDTTMEENASLVVQDKTVQSPNSLLYIAKKYEVNFLRNTELFGYMKGALAASKQVNDSQKDVRKRRFKNWLENVYENLDVDASNSTGSLSKWFSGDFSEINSSQINNTETSSPSATTVISQIRGTTE